MKTRQSEAERIRCCVFGRVSCHAFWVRPFPIWPQPPLYRSWLGLVCQLWRRLHKGKEKGDENSWEYWFVLICKTVWKLMRGQTAAEYSQIFPEGRRKRKIFSRDEILGSLEAQGTAGALLPLSPATFSPPLLLSFQPPSLPPLLLCLCFLLCFYLFFFLPVSPSQMQLNFADTGGALKCCISSTCCTCCFSNWIQLDWKMLIDHMGV